LQAVKGKKGACPCPDRTRVKSWIEPFRGVMQKPLNFFRHLL
jgi:hypothetical protein